MCHIYNPYPDAFLRQLAAEQLNALPGVDGLQAQAVVEAACASLSHGRFSEIKRRG
ncbi:MAG: hypothetical protein QRY16_02365 [Enterobacterales bacterium endosymbiont of Blomia tropicalis]|uniref:hypothetical protein n=1 Tax=Mixta mediterraneensis TaxID=2758443 RepID=UPI0025A83482|nr:hypothetical protein [Mixta mediterraneensis]MDL4912664.1 hypothetical protein [Mixta mediterraneensis]